MRKRNLVAVVAVLALLVALVGPPGLAANEAALPSATIVDLGSSRATPPASPTR